MLKSLDCWPSLPIVLEYGGGSPALYPPASEDEDNIVAALKRSGRVCSTQLTVTLSLLEKISLIEEPFSNLENHVLLCEDYMELELPSAFWWGLRLQSLHTTRVALSALPRLLYSSRDLVVIRLHDIVSVANLPPETLADALSGMNQVRLLSLHFLPITRFTGAPSLYVEDLSIYATRRESGLPEDSCERWEILLNPFRDTKPLNRHHSFVATTKAVQTFATSTTETLHTGAMPRCALCPMS